MLNVINILAQTKGTETMPVPGLVDYIGLALAIAGIVLFVKWLGETRFGTKSLIDSHPRRNSMAFYTPLIPLMVWLVLGGSLAIVFKKALAGYPDEAQRYIELLASGVVAIAILAICLILIPRHFARSYKGFGLRLSKVREDFLQGLLTLIGALPAVSLMVLITMGVGKLIYGPDWTIQKHEGLEILTQYPDWTMRFLLIILTIVMAPIVEETLFRGFMQTMFRNYLGSPWIAIVCSSALFAAAHGIMAHWPTLFVLAMALGYAYERSGSLLQSMFMHSIFNATSLIGTMLQGG